MLPTSQEKLIDAAGRHADKGLVWEVKYICVCNLFNDAFSSSDYNGRIVNNKLESGTMR
jgi:hypothetical protein